MKGVRRTESGGIPADVSLGRRFTDPEHPPTPHGTLWWDHIRAGGLAAPLFASLLPCRWQRV